MRLRVLGVVTAAVAAAATLSLPATAATPLVITTTTLAPVYEGTAVSVPLKASGGGFVKSWHLVGGALPTGVSLTAAGYLKGTPATSGTSSFAVQVTSGGQSAAATLTWQVRAMEITSPGPGAVPVDQNLRVTQLTVKGGDGPYHWSIVSGQLPMGITMTSAGRISGSAHFFPGAYPFTVAVTDAQNRVATRQYQLDLLPMAIITPGLPQATRGRLYSASLQVYGGKGTFVWTVVAGALPPGLKLSTTGVISGVPTLSGSYTVTIDVHEKDLILPNGAQRTFLMIVN